MALGTEDASRRTHWLSTIDVSEALGINLREVWDLIESGALPGDRVGRTTLVRSTALQAYIEKRQRGSAHQGS